MVSIKNDFATAKIEEKGAELRSFCVDGKEYIWGGAPEVWSGTAPILSPICGGLKDDKYIYEDKEYTINKHGFVRNKVFEVESNTESSVTFLTRDDKDTIKSFPFEFELRVTFTLVDKSLKVKYTVKNKNNKTMYFSIGSHEAYATPEGIEEYDIIFPQKETLNATILDGNLLEKNKLPIIKNSDVLPLYDKYFLIDALVFEDLKSRSVILRNRKNEKVIKVDFPNCDYFLLWHKHGTGYMCLEPWAGIQDFQDSDYDITHKKGIVSLSAGNEYTNEHIITVITPEE